MKRMLALGELSAINYIYVVQKYREKLQKKKESSQWLERGVELQLWNEGLYVEAFDKRRELLTWLCDFFFTGQRYTNVGNKFNFLWKAERSYITRVHLARRKKVSGPER